MTVPDVKIFKIYIINNNNTLRPKVPHTSPALHACPDPLYPMSSNWPPSISGAVFSLSPVSCHVHWKVAEPGCPQC